MQLGTIGVWSGVLRNGERAAVLEAAAELEELGYGTIWFPAGPPDGLADHIQAILDHTHRAVVATGIVNIWTHPPEAIAAQHHALTQAHPGRFLLGLGVSHEPIVTGAGQTYAQPYRKMIAYLDALDASPTPVPLDERILAALGPRMLHLAAERSLGSHPYFVPPEHTRFARQVVGPNKIVAPEQMVVVESDPDRARKIARLSAGRYLSMPNYTNNLLRYGFSADDIAAGGTDRLIDAIVAWGTAEQVMARVREHHAAGADHVCIQPLTEPPQDLGQSMSAWRQLAAVGRG